MCANTCLKMGAEFEARKVENKQICSHWLTITFCCFGFNSMQQWQKLIEN